MPIYGIFTLILINLFRTRGSFQLITRSHKPFGHVPHMNISLPNMDPAEDNEIWVSQSRSSYNVEPDPSLPAKGTVIVEFENNRYNVPFNNTYTLQNYPNNDIFKLSMKILKESNETKVAL